MAKLLGDEDVTTALESLPGWSRDADALVREVDVPADDQDTLEGSVARVADEMDHHPEVARSGDSMTFRLWTHSAGGITAKDVELASRIDQVLSGPSSSW